MQVEINRLEQVFSFDDRKMKTYLVLTLPSGTEIRSAISDEDSEQVVGEVMGGVEAEPVEKPLYIQRGVYEDTDGKQHDLAAGDWGPTVTEQPEETEEEQFNWMELPENILPIGAKRLLAESGAEDVLTLDQIKDILQPKPPMLKQVPRSPSVRTDEMGNPIVTQRAQTLPVEDEDGVAQL